ncbi:TPA: hypothetical protein ACH3X1_013295 [Trebouxia sp. C0004]
MTQLHPMLLAQLLLLQTLLSELLLGLLLFLLKVSLLLTELPLPPTLSLLLLAHLPASSAEFLSTLFGNIDSINSCRHVDKLQIFVGALLGKVMQQQQELCSKGSGFQKQQADTTTLVNLVFSQDAARIKVIQSHEQMVLLQSLLKRSMEEWKLNAWQKDSAFASDAAVPTAATSEAADALSVVAAADVTLS